MLSHPLHFQVNFDIVESIDDFENSLDVILSQCGN